MVQFLRRRSWLLLALSLAVLPAIVGVCLMTLSNSGQISKTNFDRIKHGMTVEEVDALFGKELACARMNVEFPDGHTEQFQSLYAGKPGFFPIRSIWVEYANGRVIRKEFRVPSTRAMLIPVLARIGLRQLIASRAVNSGPTPPDTEPVLPRPER
jgi:hypothetical protein